MVAPSLSTKVYEKNKNKKVTSFNKNKKVTCKKNYFL